MKASAPGKLVLLGDYAVLEGGLALVAAVDRRATGWVDPEGPPSEVVQGVLERARAAGFTLPGVRVDTGGFYEEGGEKLGIGSSAAVAVVTAALATHRSDATCFDIALQGHRDAAGGVGSGIDVAASFQGGVIATKSQPADVERLSPRLPGLHLSVLYANQSASTADLVRACRASERWSEWMLRMKPLARAGIEAWRLGRVTPFLEAVAAYGRAMQGMGQDAGVPVVTEAIESIMRLADEAGGAAKPSGAGGGDVVVVFARSEDIGRRIAKATSTRWVEVSVDPLGLRYESL